MKTPHRTQVGVSLAMILSTMSVGVARGLNANVLRWTRAVHSSTPPKIHRVAATLNKADNVEIEQLARQSTGITGSIPSPCVFGGLSYLDTSSLDSRNSHRVIFVLGGPGAGKGTQSQQIVQTYNCVHLSVGELLRSTAQRENYPHAELVKDFLIKGRIVPVEISLAILRRAMDDSAREGFASRIFLVDGFPRNFDNVHGWIEHMPPHAAVMGALVYHCPMHVLEERILSRAETSGRSDDNLESVRKRFDTFQKETEPVVRVLERVEQLQAEENESSRLRVVSIDATGSVEEVWERTKRAMDSFVRNDVLTANVQLLLEEDVDILSSISNAQVNVVDGMEAVVTYDRKPAGTSEIRAREIRTWRHGPLGWKCIKVERRS